MPRSPKITEALAETSSAERGTRLEESESRTSEPLTKPHFAISSRTQRLALSLLGVILLSGILHYEFRLLPQARAGRPLAYSYDLWVIWNGSRAALHRENPYSETVTTRIQRGLGLTHKPEGDQERYAYPIYSSLIYSPIALLPFEYARWAALIPITASIIAAIIFFEVPLKIPILIAVASSSQVLEIFESGQLGVVAIGFIAAGLWAYRRNAFVYAGVLVGLALIKPHLVAILVLVLIRNRRFLYSFSATALLLFLASFLLHPQWLPDWIHTVAAYREYTNPPVLQFALGKWVALVAILGLAVFSIRRNSPELALSTAVVGLATSGAIYDHLLLLPGIVLILSNLHLFVSPVRKLMLRILLFLGLWPWLSATVVSALVLSGTRPTEFLMELPSRSFGGFSVGVLLLVVLILLRTDNSKTLAPHEQPC